MDTKGGVHVLLFIFLTLFVSLSSAGQSPHNGSSSKSYAGLMSGPMTVSADVTRSYGQLPLGFEPNVGQTDPQVQFLAHGKGYELFLTEREAVLALQDSTPTRPLPGRRADFLRAWRKRRGLATSSVLRIRPLEGNQHARIIGTNELSGKSNYFIGNDPKNWRTDVPTYARVKYEEVYPGVDLTFYGDHRRLEWDVIVAPGADPGQVAFHIDGSRTMRIDAQGNLHISVGAGEVELKKPIVYQQEAGVRREVQGRYALIAGHNVRFRVGAYDPSTPLIVDPALDYSTYLGGSADEFGSSIAVDSNGDAYVAGSTGSTNFPTTSNSIEPKAPAGIGTGAVFVTQLNPTGTSVLYSTYIGGNNGEGGFGIALDSASPPDVYVTGYTCSTNFPTTSNAYLPTFTPPVCNGSGGTGFVTEFNPAVSGAGALKYSTYLGGNGAEIGEAIAVDANKNIYVTGFTYSTSFPVTSGAFQSTNKGGGTLDNAFVTRLNPSISGSGSLIYSTYLGGAGNQTNSLGDEGFGIAVDSASNVYITGDTASANFPTTASAFMATAPAGVANQTGFVARINTALAGAQSLVYSTFLGGATSDAGNGIALGPQNVAYVVGNTSSSNFPVTAGAYQTTAPGGVSGLGVSFLSLVNTSQSNTSSLVYSTFWGGNTGDYGGSITVDSSGNAYIGGSTYSSNFPVTTGAFQTTMKGPCTGFLSELMPSGNGSADLIYSTFFDGTESATTCDNLAVGVYALALDSTNNAYLTGATGATDFPVSPSNAFQTSLKSIPDAFIAKFSVTPKILPVPSISSLSRSFGTTGTAVTIWGSDFGMFQGTSTITFGSVVAGIASWSSTSIVAYVPSGEAPGIVDVAVQTSIAKSNTVPFTVVTNTTGCP
jgi:hypothetical protein